MYNSFNLNVAKDISRVKKIQDGCGRVRVWLRLTGGSFHQHMDPNRPQSGPVCAETIVDFIHKKSKTFGCISYSVRIYSAVRVLQVSIFSTFSVRGRQYQETLYAKAWVYAYTYIYALNALITVLTLTILYVLCSTCIQSVPTCTCSNYLIIVYTI